VNAAGIGGGGIRLHQYPTEAYARIMDVNATGVFLSLKHEINLMLKLSAGSIVNISSVAGVTGNMRNAPYSASKHAVIGLTRSAALDYARRGIRINAVCPGFTRTPAMEGALTSEDIREFERLVPMGRIAAPAEIAAMVLFLCSEAASYVTGQAICVDGGLRS
jgi:NAD(P)-dependent dehydrogenase (short-subunit alcohol dehydrogenase family)